MAGPQILLSGGALGAEIKGLDLREELSSDDVGSLHHALLDHCVLLFRGQEITEEEHVRFSRYFGKPVPHVREQNPRPVPEIFVISNVEEDGKPIGALGYEEIQFHSDLSYLPRPGSISILYAVEVPAHGGETFWVNGYAAYDALDGKIKKRGSTLKAIHRHPREQQNPATPACHPVFRTHPETGRRTLYVSPQFTREIVGISPGESRELLHELIRHAMEPRFIWTHHWKPGDLMMWDNRCTMHRREAFDNSERRVMKRTQMLGDEPF